MKEQHFTDKRSLKSSAILKELAEDAATVICAHTEVHSKPEKDWISNEAALFEEYKINEIQQPKFLTMVKGFIANFIQESGHSPFDTIEI